MTSICTDVIIHHQSSLACPSAQVSAPKLIFLLNMEYNAKSEINLL